MINSLLTKYSQRFPQDNELVSRFQEFIQSADSPFSRDCLAGHLTGSAIILNSNLNSVVLLHHRKLGFWMQPGGHADEDQDLERVARKEAFEETGLADLLPVPSTIIGLSIHEIPARKDVPDHLHYDVRFAFTSPVSELVRNEESNDVQWFPIASLSVETELSSHIIRARDLFRLKKD